MIVVQATTSRSVPVDVSTVIELVLRDASGALLPVASGTLAVYVDGVAEDTAPTVTAGGPPRATVAPSLTGEWLEIWSVTLDDGRTLKAHVHGRVSPVSLACPISGQDLIDEVPSLEDSTPLGVNYDRELQAAWRWTLRRLKQQGREPGRIQDADALTETVLQKALENVYRQRALEDHSELYMAEAKRRGDLAIDAWNSVQLRYIKGTEATSITTPTKPAPGLSGFFAGK